jgi:hypothetical protein
MSVCWVQISGLLKQPIDIHEILMITMLLEATPPSHHNMETGSVRTCEDRATLAPEPSS